MITLESLYSKYRYYESIFKNIDNEIITQLEDLTDRHSLMDIVQSFTFTYHHDYKICNCGPMGIVIVNESNDIINPVTHFKLIELWKLPIDVENWQENDLKYETEEKVILHLILRLFIMETFISPVIIMIYIRQN